MTWVPTKCLVSRQRREKPWPRYPGGSVPDSVHYQRSQTAEEMKQEERAVGHLSGPTGCPHELPWELSSAALSGGGRRERGLICVEQLVETAPAAAAPAFIKSLLTSGAGRASPRPPSWRSGRLCLPVSGSGTCQLLVPASTFFH